jgi:hypothetical protein
VGWYEMVLVEIARFRQVLWNLAGTTGLEPATSCVTVIYPMIARISLSKLPHSIHAVALLS